MLAGSVADFREMARRRVPPFIFEYVDGGAYNEITLGRNVSDLQAIALRQRVLRDVSRISLQTELLGQTLALPAILAPIGLGGMNARRGEVQAYRAANAKGVPFCLSTVGLCPIEEVAGAGTQPFWFQLYMLRDRGFVASMLQRAAAAACPVLVFTVDLPVTGTRYRDFHSGLTGVTSAAGKLRLAAQALAHPAWAWDVALRGAPLSLGNLSEAVGKGAVFGDFLAWIGRNMDASVTWDDIGWVRRNWPGKLIIKGVLTAEDAREAVRAGADGIIVSNHGGRQLDGVPSTARALPRVAQAVGDELVVMADGGVRSGLDIVRMMALGARAVLLGRAWVYALGAQGEAGVARMLDLMAAEMRVAMALTGCPDIAQIGPHILDHV